MKHLFLSLLALSAIPALALPAFAQGGKPRGIHKADWELGAFHLGKNSVQYRVTNLGFTTAPATSIQLTITNPQTSRQVYSAYKAQAALQPNASMTVSFTNLPKFQNGVIRAMVDPSNQVAEPSEKNNVHATLVTHPFGPDIQASNMFFHSDKQLSVTIRNNGPGNLPEQIDATLTTHFGQNNGQSIRQNIPRLDAGKYRVLLFTLQRPLKKGTTVVVQGDSGLRIRERNEGNNQAVRTYIPGQQ